MRLPLSDHGYIEPSCLCTKQALGASASKLLDPGLGTHRRTITFSQQVVWTPEVPPGPLLLRYIHTHKKTRESCLASKNSYYLFLPISVREDPPSTTCNKAYIDNMKNTVSTCITTPHKGILLHSHLVWVWYQRHHASCTEVVFFSTQKYVQTLFSSLGILQAKRATANLTTVDFSCVCTFRVACMGNLCFGKCCVLHCSLWAVQTINFPYTQHGIFKRNCRD